jgi:hypothetical protein
MNDISLSFSLRQRLHSDQTQRLMNPGRFAPMTCSPRVVSPRWPVRPGSFCPGLFRPGKWVDSPRKVSRFAPLNCYYIIIDEVFFDNFLIIILCHMFSYNLFYFDFHSARITDSKSCQIIESVLKYKNGFKNNLMYKEIFNYFPI